MEMFSDNVAQQLKAFARDCIKNPSLLHDPKIFFIKDLIEHYGGKVPEAKTNDSSDAKTEFESKPAEPQPKPEPASEESEESDLGLDMTGVIEPDKDAPQKMGNLTLQPTEEEIAESQAKRSEAASAFVEKDYEKAKQLYTEAIVLSNRSGSRSASPRRPRTADGGLRDSRLHSRSRKSRERKELKEVNKYSRSRSRFASRDRKLYRGSKYTVGHRSSRSRSRSPYRDSRYSRRSRSYSRLRYSRDRHVYRSHSRSSMLSRRRHIGNRENSCPSRCLSVFGLSTSMTEQEIQRIFSPHGTVERVQVDIDAKKHSRGFVYFKSSKDAKVAKDQCNGIEINGRRIRVDFSITQRAHTSTPGKSTHLHDRNWDAPRRREVSYRESNRRSPSPYYSRRRSHYDRSRSRSYSPRKRRKHSQDASEQPPILRSKQEVAQQPSSRCLDVSDLGMTDPFRSQITKKSKMTSTDWTYYYNMIPKRTDPKGGSVGVPVWTNMFKITFDDKKLLTNIVRYKIHIEPQGKETEKELNLPKSVCINIFEQFCKKYFQKSLKKRYLAYDGKKEAYSADDLDFDGDNRKSLHWVINENEPLGGGLILGCGVRMTVMVGWCPYLNVNVSYKGFTTKQRVLDYVAEVLRVKKDKITYDAVMNDPKIQSFLSGLKVTYEIPNVSRRTHCIITLSPKTFNEEIEGLMRPELPTLHVGTKADGTEILLPIELCTIMPNQPITKLDEEQTTNMRKAIDALTHKNRIEKAFDKIQVNDSLVMSSEFHLSVHPKMEEVRARVLSAPELRYATGKTTVEHGTWRIQPFYEAKHLKESTWTIVNLSGMPNLEPAMQEFAKMLQTTG